MTEAPKSTYVPAAKTLLEDVKRLADGAGFYSDNYKRLMRFTDRMSVQRFSVTESTREEKGAQIWAKGSKRPILEILLGAGGTQLVALNRTIEELTVWLVPYQEIGNDQGLREVVRDIVIDSRKPTAVYPLLKHQKAD